MATTRRKSASTASTHRRSTAAGSRTAAPARKKSTARKSAARKSSARKPAATKTASRKTAAKKSARKYSPGASSFVEQEMKEMKHGKLKSGNSGKKVRNPKQAIAIGLSEARRAGEKVPAPRKRKAA